MYVSLSRHFPANHSSALVVIVIWAYVSLNGMWEPSAHKFNFRKLAQRSGNNAWMWMIIQTPSSYFFSCINENGSETTEPNKLHFCIKSRPFFCIGKGKEMQRNRKILNELYATCDKIYTRSHTHKFISMSTICKHIMTTNACNFISLFLSFFATGFLFPLFFSSSPFVQIVPVDEQQWHSFCCVHKNRATIRTLSNTHIEKTCNENNYCGITITEDVKWNEQEKKRWWWHCKVERKK